MKIAKIAAWAVTLLVINTGCVTSSTSYKAPSRSSSHAKLKNTWIRNSLHSWESYSVESIDGLYVTYLVDRDWTSFRITPGERNLVVSSQFNRSLGDSCPCRAFGRISFTAEEGKTYRVAGQVEGTNVAFWVNDDETGEKISEVIRNEYQSSPRPVYMPIYVPSN